MDKVLETLERIRTLWLRMGRTKRHSAEYDVLMHEIRVESDAYRELIEAVNSSHEKGNDS